ncbi:MAG: hypothetical protein ACPHUF_01030 [Gammaproteobacteria bacterium]
MNPELVRLSWIEVTMQRLWLIPAAILGTALLLVQSGMPHAGLSTIAISAFVLLTMVWGAKQSADAILDEVRDRTWEIQRMCALPPWTMTWGKLLGATLMPWYAGAVCLALYMNFAGGDQEAPATVLTYSLLAVILQAFALTIALVATHLDRRVRARLNLLLMLVLLSLVLPDLARLGMPQFNELSVLGQSIFWYGVELDGTAFTLTMAAIFAAWAIVAAWRMMCIELGVRTRPFAWLGFVAFLAALCGGYVYDPHGLGIVRQLLSGAAVIACCLGYLAAFCFARDPVAISRMLLALKLGQTRRTLESTPLWVSATAIALMLAVGAAVVGSDTGSPNDRFDNLGACALVFALLLLRDVAMLAAFSFRNPAGRSDVTTLVWIAVLNRLLPGLFAVSDLQMLSNLMRPAIFDAPKTALAIALVHALIAVGFAHYFYRRSMRLQPTR